MDDILKLKELIDVDTFAPVAKQLQQKVGDTAAVPVLATAWCCHSRACAGHAVLRPEHRALTAPRSLSTRSRTSWHPRLPTPQAWLMHWSLFVFFNHESGLNALIDLFMQDRCGRRRALPVVCIACCSACVSSPRADPPNTPCRQASAHAGLAPLLTLPVTLPPHGYKYTCLHHPAPPQVPDCHPADVAAPAALPGSGGGGQQA